MMNITQIPTMAQSFYTVTKARFGWAVVLVTPQAGQNIKTSLYACGSREAAIEHGKATAAMAHRPFKYRGASA